MAHLLHNLQSPPENVRNSNFWWKCRKSQI